MWWHMPLIPALRRKKQAYLCEFEATLTYIVRSCLKKKKEIKIKHNSECRGRVDSGKTPGKRVEDNHGWDIK